MVSRNSGKKEKPPTSSKAKHRKAKQKRNKKEAKKKQKRSKKEAIRNDDPTTKNQKIAPMICPSNPTSPQNPCKDQQMNQQVTPSQTHKANP
jgi:hypothetical protein